MRSDSPAEGAGLEVGDVSSRSTGTRSRRRPSSRRRSTTRRRASRCTLGIVRDGATRGCHGPPRHTTVVSGVGATLVRQVTQSLSARLERAPPRPWSGEPALVGEDHRLDAVAEPELHQDPLDVRLHRRLLDHELRGDLGVRETAGDAARAPRARAGSARGAARRRRPRRPAARAMRSITRRVTDGERSESPAATVLIAREQLLRGRALEQEAGGAGGQRAEDVLVVLERREDHDPDVGDAVATISRVAAIPSRPGMRTSIRTTSGRCSRTPRARPAPSAASPTTSHAVVAREDGREAGAHEVVVVDEQDADGRRSRPPVTVRERRVHAERAVARGRLERAAEQEARSRMPTMPCPRRAAPRRRAGWSTVISSADGPSSRATSARAGAVAGGVRERLLQDPVRGLVDGAARARAARPRSRRSARARRRGSARGGCRARRARRAARRRSDAPSSRSARTSWSISPSVSRATSSIVSIAARERAGSCSSSSRAAPAWTRMTLTAWPAESCRSRAIRVRSSALASRRSRSASRSARRALRLRRDARAALPQPVAGEPGERPRRACRRAPRARRRTGRATARRGPRGSPRGPPSGAAGGCRAGLPRDGEERDRERDRRKPVAEPVEGPGGERHDRQDRQRGDPSRRERHRHQQCEAAAEPVELAAVRGRARRGPSRRATSRRAR